MLPSIYIPLTRNNSADTGPNHSAIALELLAVHDDVTLAPQDLSEWLKLKSNDPSCCRAIGSLLGCAGPTNRIRGI